MRILLLSIGILGLLASAARADDVAAKIIGKLPDNTNGQTVYIFKLKENGITVRATPDEFCSQMGYGQAAKYHHEENGEAQTLAEQGNEETGKDDKKLFGTLNWVVCQYPKQPKQSKQPKQ